MNFLGLFVLALGVAMDAFAVAICLGLGMKKATVKKALIVGVYFGIFQAAMPLVGYLVASLFADSITDYDHWIAFGLLLFLGAKIIWNAFQKNETGCCNEVPLTPKKMLPYAIATSIDALAVGVTFAFLSVKIVPAVLIIGATTLILSMIGVKLGNLFGVKFRSKAEIAGGIILILIGTKVLLEHLNILVF